MIVKDCQTNSSSDDKNVYYKIYSSVYFFIFLFVFIYCFRTDHYFKVY